MRRWVLVCVVGLLCSLSLLGNPRQVFGAVVNGSCTCQIAPTPTSGTFESVPLTTEEECDPTVTISGKKYTQCSWTPLSENVFACQCKKVGEQQVRGIESRGTCTTAVAEPLLKTGGQMKVGETLLGCSWVGEDPDLEQSNGQMFAAPLRTKIRELDKFNGKTIPQVIGTLVQVGMGVLGIIALIIFIYGGIWWMLANGDSHREQQAKDTILWGSIGIVVILSSYAIVTYLLGSF